MIRKRFIKNLNECERLLQIALDFTKLNQAVKLAMLFPKKKATILEVGTPLIKSWGVTPVKVFRAVPGEHLVLADTKSVDTGRLEASLMADAGADAVTVLALAPDETIGEMVDYGRERGLTIYGDLIGARNYLEEAKRLKKLGIDVILLHIGIDVQKRLGLRASEMIELVNKISKEFSGPVAVAGGIKPNEVDKIINAGASIVIIGGGITKAKDPVEAFQEAFRRLSPRC